MSNSVNLALDVTKTGIQNPLIKVRQGDGGFETLHTTVTSNGEPLNLQGWTITFMGTTAGNHKIVDGNVNIVEAPNGIFDYTPSKAWGMDIGDFKMAYFKFVKGDGSASSANFRVSVIEAVDLTQDEAKNYISVVDATIAEAKQHLTDSLATVTQSIADANNNANTVSSNVNTLGKRVDDYNSKLSAVKVGGRNLVLGTSEQVVQALNWNFEVANIKYDKVLGNQFYASVMINNAVHSDVLATGSAQLVLQAVDSNGNVLATSKGSTISYNANGLSQCSISANESTAYIKAYIMTISMLKNAYYSRLKIERGNVPTDWTPAPEDVPSNDAQLVHKTGTETIAGDKTFTSPVNGQLSGNAATATKWQTARTLALTGDVTGSVSIDGSNNVSIATTGTNLVHKSGTEMIAGDKTFTGNITASGTIKSSNQYLDVGSRVKSVDASGVTTMWFGWQVYWTIRNGYVNYQIRTTANGTIKPGSKSDEALPLEARPLLKVFVPLRWGGQGFSINTDGKLENDTGVNIDPSASWATAVSANAQGW